MTAPAPQNDKTFLDRWSDGAIPFMLGMIVAMGAFIIVMFTVNIMIVTRIIYPHA